MRINDAAPPWADCRFMIGTADIPSSSLLLDGKKALGSACGTVHVIEDDPSVRRGLLACLQDDGCDVVGYACGRDFLAAPIPARGDVVVLDLLLPDIAGAEVARQLRHRSPGARLVVISGMRRRAFEVATAQIRPDAAFRKPLDVKEFLQSVLQLSRARQYT